MSTIGYTEEQSLAILRHVLGHYQPKPVPSGYNHLEIHGPSLDLNICNRMTSDGLLIYRGTFADSLDSRKHLFQATEKGIQFLKDHTPKPMPTPPPTREEIARILGQEPVFPVITTDGNQHLGLTRRQQIAVMVLQAMISNPKAVSSDGEFNIGNLASAWAIADRFLAEEGPVKP